MPLVLVLEKSNLPFWLLVCPGVELAKAIWSSSFSPARSKRAPRAQGVVADDARDGVGEVEDLALRVRGVGAAVERGDAGCIKRDGGDFVWEILACRKEVGIVDAVCGAVVGAGRCVDAEASGVMAGGEEKFVGGTGTEGVDVVERAGLVGTAVDARDDVVVRRREGVHLVIVEVNEAEADVVLLGWKDVEIAAVDLLLDGIVCGLEQVGCTNLKAWCWCGEGIEQTYAIWAKAIFGDDVAGKTAGAARLRIAGETGHGVFDVLRDGAEVAGSEGCVGDGVGLGGERGIAHEGFGVEEEDFALG